MAKLVDIHNLLLNNPNYASLSPEKRIEILNFAAQTFVDDSIVCLNNEVQGTYERFSKYDFSILSLAITELIDNFLSDDDYLSKFTVDERMLIYNIVQNKIALSYNSDAVNPYLVNNMQGDYRSIDKTFEPLLIDTISIENLAAILTTFNPMLQPTAALINYRFIYSTFIPVLSLAISIADQIEGNFVPDLNNTLEILSLLSIESNFIPSLIVSLSYGMDLTGNFIPQLSVLSEIIIDYNYEMSYTFIPSLTLTLAME